jgi:branched-chain amino acid transport system ATP-binding protein
MLEVKELNGGYGPIQVLWNVSLRLDRGEIVTLLGANGAGKTTLIRTLAGELKPSGGSVEFLGRDITKVPTHQIVNAGLVEIPEGRQLWSGLSVEDNLELGAYSTRARASLKQSKDWVYSLFPILMERRSSPARNLSGGQQQMLAISRGLMASPRLLLLDEPSLGLAPLIVKQIFEMISELRRSGKTILLVEQMANLALKAADRAYVLERGEVVLEGSARELLSHPRVTSGYLGRRAAERSNPTTMARHTHPSSTKDNRHE